VRLFFLKSKNGWDSWDSREKHEGKSLSQLKKMVGTWLGRLGQKVFQNGWDSWDSWDEQKMVGTVGTAFFSLPRQV
jgi:hypothetical protein